MFNELRDKIAASPFAHSIIPRSDGSFAIYDGFLSREGYVLSEMQVQAALDATPHRYLENNKVQTISIAAFVIMFGIGFFIPINFGQILFVISWITLYRLLFEWPEWRHHMRRHYGSVKLPMHRFPAQYFRLANWIDHSGKFQAAISFFYAWIAYWTVKFGYEQFLLHDLTWLLYLWFASYLVVYALGGFAIILAVTAFRIRHRRMPLIGDLQPIDPETGKMAFPIMAPPQSPCPAIKKPF